MGEGITEFELIDLLKARSGRSGRMETGIGDDAAVTVPGGATATSVDALVEGIHFRSDWSSPEDVAHKALATALSDLAAMAAEPGEMYVTLGVPAGTPAPYLERLATGFSETAANFGTVLAGGDTVSSPVLFVAVTVVGHAGRAGEFVLRSGASTDDVVAVTGSVGGAGAGLWLLGNEAVEIKDLDAEVRAALVERQLRPEPRLYAGRVLGRLGATAMVDVSDGLVADLGHVAQQSAVAISLDVRPVPAQAGVAMVESAAGLALGDLALAGGEDYELAVTLPGHDFEPAREALRALDLDLTAIGRVASGSGVTLVDEGGARAAPAGFDHLA